MGTVVSEISSWSALSWHTGRKTKNMKSKYFGIFIMKILIVIEANAYLKEYSTKQQETQTTNKICY